MSDVLKDAIDIYAGLESTDKAFLSELRHGKTRINKAIAYRRSALDKEADEKLTASVAKLHPMFLPTPEAKKAHKEILELQTTLPMNVEDFQDWYSFVIETTCKTCTRADYEECPARRVLNKYEVFPFDPEAKNKCQYSYAMPEENEIASLGIVSAVTSNDTGETLAKIQDDCECVELREAKQQINIMENDYKALYERNRNLIQQVEELTIEQINDSLECDSEEETGDYMSIEILLNTGEKPSMCLPARMVECLMEEIKRPNRLTRSICSQHVNDELITIDMQNVVAIHVTGLPELDWIRPQPVYEYTTEQERYRVECKCGAEYFCNMNPSRPKARCRDCQSIVYADRGAGKVVDPCNTTGATLLTNRYYVEDKPKVSEHIENSSGHDLREISKNNGRGYKDPCKIL
ncbi:hypothetical protein UFO1_2489 [Pelosinus sp. UFO1]|nr:hypothetical protein UFO1_2489 [Pelosinus sp. UFO1]